MTKLGRQRGSKRDLSHIKWRDHTPAFTWVALILLLLFFLFGVIWEIRYPSHSGLKHRPTVAESLRGRRFQAPDIVDVSTGAVR